MMSSAVCLCKTITAPYPRLLKTGYSITFSSIRSSIPKNYGCIRQYRPIHNTSNFKKLFGMVSQNSRKVMTLTTDKITQKHKNLVGIWMLGCSGMVFVAVALGGVTRLTESGLSMVTWRLLGEKRPTTEEEWISEFQRYQQYPEYKLIKKDLTLEEFKWIWWMEYSHRTWGRLIGGAFLLPAVAFWVSGCFTAAMKKRVLMCGALIAAQGLMGWYMVKSGLEDRFHEPSDVPRVSQYRLAAHLGLALTLYAVFLRGALRSFLTLRTSTESISRGFKILAHSCKGMVFLTALSGAFVAGLDAGLVYNSYPKMGDKWIPDDLLAFSPKFKNFTENPTTVQFDHRILGTATLTLISVLWILSRKRALPPRARLAVNAITAMAWLQVALGITTLVTYVPTSVAVSHQSGSLVLLSFAVWLTHELKLLKYIPK